VDRRDFVKHAAAVSALAWSCSSSAERREGRTLTSRRVRPGDPEWPSESRWADLNREVGGRLIRVESPLAACRAAAEGALSGDLAADVTACDEVLRRMRNPFYVGSEPALTQTSGWVDAWATEPSVYAVAARQTADVVAAVDFARENNLRLVVKGGGHSYQGTSCAPDSLLVWTRRMNRITLHDEFVARGCEGSQPPRPAVTVEAGAIWMEVYAAVTTEAGRYVQGGGCTTVGVAGLIQSGGFGSFTKAYGLAAAGLLEAEVVTADGEVRIANPCSHPELFWGLKGGGGGSLGVVTRLTLRTRELPETFGGAFGRIRATSDRAYRALIGRTVDLYREQLFNPHWGEQIVFEGGDAVRIAMVFQGLNEDEAAAAWQPLLDWVAASPEDYVVDQPVGFLVAPARRLWDAGFLEQYAPGLAVLDDRADAASGHFSWAGNQGEVGQFLHGYRSAWLPGDLLEADRREALASALFAAARQWTVSLHFNKGLAGATDEEIAAARDTAMNPAVLDAFALAIIAGEGPPAFPGIPGREPDLATGRREARRIDRAMDELLEVVPNGGSYVAESDYFEENWQRSFWGSNYARLAAVKREYDPEGLFFVRHGVGSEGWSDDGFERVGSD
jgi:FAD/FMN-containing dehydrogenase